MRASRNSGWKSTRQILQACFLLAHAGEFFRIFFGLFIEVLVCRRADIRSQMNVGDPLNFLDERA